MTRQRVVVVGGGLAGITAALRCLDAGAAVTLLEARSRLGGATSSFRRGDLWVDTGQHVFLRCYSAYRRLLDRLGVSAAVSVQDRFRVPLLAPGHRPVTLRRANLPAPAHLLPALAAHRLLSPTDRLRAVGTALALRRLDPDDPALDERSFGAWLRDQGASRRAVDGLWGLLTLAALNTGVDTASLALAARVFRTGLLDSTDGGDIGLPRLPLGELHGDAAHRALTGGGATVRLRAKAVDLRRSGSRWRVHHDGTVLDADAVVLAVPHQDAATLLQRLPLPATRGWASLAASPIVNIHVRYDRPVTRLPFAAAVGSPVQWVFDRTAVAGAPCGQYLAVSLSAAEDYLPARTGELRDLFLPALAALFPRAAGAEVRDFFVTREPRATFRQAPGSRAVRPAADTTLPGLILAGAWVDTGWPDTMEGAVRSGESAADLLVRDTRHRNTDVAEVPA